MVVVNLPPFQSCFFTGDWILIVYHALRQFGFVDRTNQNDEITGQQFAFIDLSNFKHFWYFTFWSAFGSYVIFFGLGGFLHVFIINQIVVTTDI